MKRKKFRKVLTGLLAMSMLTTVSFADRTDDYGTTLDAGRYDVNVQYTEDGDTINSTYTIDVWGPPRFTTDLPSTLYFAGGKMLTPITAQATGGWPDTVVYQWWKKPAAGEINNLALLRNSPMLNVGNSDYGLLSTQLDGFTPLAGEVGTEFVYNNVSKTAHGSQFAVTAVNGVWETPTLSSYGVMTLAEPTGLTNFNLNATEFKEGLETIDLANSTVTVQTAQGDVIVPLDSEYVSVTGFDNTADVGVQNGQTVTVTYDDGVNPTVSTSRTVTIEPKMIVNTVVETNPTKNSYKEGMTFDPTGLEIRVNYDNGTYDIFGAESFEFSTDQLQLGQTSVRSVVRKDVGTPYESQADVVVPITVSMKSAIRLEVTRECDTLVYYEYDELSWDGIEITIFWDNGFDSVAQDSEVVFEDLSTIRGVRGVHTKTISRDGVSVPITFEVFTFDRAQVGTIPSNATVEKGDASAVDFSNGTIIETLSNGVEEITKVVPMSGEVSNVDWTSNDVQDVTLTYRGETLSIPVTSTYSPSSTVEIVTRPTKTMYEVGESVDISGLQVTVTGPSGYSELVNAQDIIATIDTSSSGSKELTISVLGTVVSTVPNILVYENSGMGEVIPLTPNPAPGNFTTIEIPTVNGYIVGDIIIEDGNGDTVPVQNNGNGTYTYTQPDVITNFEIKWAGDNEVVQPSYGDVVITPSVAYEGDRVTVTLIPDPSFKPGDITVTDMLGNDVPVTDNGDGSFSFDQPAGGVNIESTFDVNNIKTPVANGSIVLNPQTPEIGESVTVTPNPNPGFITSGVTVTDKNGDPVQVSPSVGGTYEFTQPVGGVTVTPTFIVDNSVLNNAHGSITTTPAVPNPGEWVVVTPTPNEGFKTDGIIVTDMYGTMLPVTDNLDGTYLYEQPVGGVTIGGIFSVDNTVTPGPNGDAVISPVNPEIGDTVVIAPDPADGFEVKDVVVKDVEGNDVTVVEKPNGTYEFVQPEGGVEVTVTFRPTNDVDIPNESGNVSMYPQNPSVGDNVIVTTTPNDGFYMEDLIVKDSEGNDIPVVNNGDGSFSYVQPNGPVTIVPDFRPEVDIDTVVGGNITLSDDKPKVGDSVTITTTPESGFYTEDVIVKDSEGNDVYVGLNPITGNYFYTQPNGPVTIEPDFRPEVTIVPDVNGVVTLYPIKPSVGDEVLIIPDSGDNFFLGNVEVEDGLGNRIPVTQNPDGSFSYTQPDGPVTIEPEFVLDSVVETPAVNGDYTISPLNPAPGETVVITPVPGPGYEVGDFIIRDENGDEIDFVVKPNGDIEYIQPSGQVTIVPEFIGSTTVGDSENGSVTLTPAMPRPGDTVTIVPTPGPGYNSVLPPIVTDGEGNEIDVTVNPDGSFSYEQPVTGGVVITPVFNPEITVPPVVGGDIDILPEYPVAGDVVVIVPDPEDGFFAEDIIITDSNGNEIPVTSNPDGSFSYTQPDSPVTIVPDFRPEVEVEDVVGGDVTLSPEKPKVDEFVSVTPDPSDGFYVEDVIVKDQNGAEVPVTKNPVSGDFEFQQPDGSVTVVPDFRPEVSIVPDANGSMELSPVKPKVDDVVTITPVPEDGYFLKDVVVTDKNGNIVPSSKNPTTGEFEYVQPDGPVTITPEFEDDTVLVIGGIPGGSMTVLPEHPSAGDIVVIKPNALPGFIPGDFYVEDENGNSIAVTVKPNGDIEYIQPDGPVIVLPEYKVENDILNSAGGQVTVTPVNPVPGQTVIITPNPEDGFVMKDVIIEDGEGNRIPVTVNPNAGNWEYVQPDCPVVIAPEFSNDAIVANPAPGGSYDVTPSDPSVGDTVVITPSALPGFSVGDFVVKDANGENIEVTIKPNGDIEFVKPEGIVTIIPQFKVENVVTPSAGGTISTTPSNPIPGNTVVIVPTPETGNIVTDVVVKDENGVDIPVIYNPNTGNWEYVQPNGPVTITPSFGRDTVIEDTVTGGTITITPYNPSVGETVVITPIPGSGYGSGAPIVKDENGNTIPVTKNPDGTYEYVQPDGVVTITPSFSVTGGGGSSSGGGGSSGGGSSSGSSNKPSDGTVTNPDGSTTTTGTKPDGTVTETTKQPDGTVTEVEKKPDGTVTEKETKPDGTITETTKKPDGTVTEVEKKTDGTVTEKETKPDGTVTETTKKPDGTVTETVTMPDGTVTETTTNPNGSKTETTKKPDGTVTETATQPNGSKTETVTYPDGTVTTIVTKPNGDTTVTTVKPNGDTTVTETVQKPNGGSVSTTTKPNGTTSTTITEVKPDGTVVEETTSSDGSKSEVITKPDGSAEYTGTTGGGTTVNGTIGTDGKVNVDVYVSESEVGTGSTVVLPMPPVVAPSVSEKAPEISIKLPEGGSASGGSNGGKTPIYIPVENVKPSTVVVVINPETGEETIITNSSVADGGLKFNVSEDTVVKVVENVVHFDDVPLNYWGHLFVDFVAGRNLMSGVSETLFKPEDETTRAQIVTVLWSMDYKPDVGEESIFADCDVGSWYTSAVNWAAKNGIVAGVSDGKFAPEDDVTREQLVTILYNYLSRDGKVVGGSPDMSKFSDVEDISSYAKSSMEWAVGNGLLIGDGEALRPSDVASRAEIATILQRFVEVSNG